MKPTTKYATPAGVRRDTFASMGTSVTVLVPEQSPVRHLAVVHKLFDRWDRTLSRFRLDSELAHVNGHAGLPARVSPLFLRVLQESLLAAAATDGIFDPTLVRQMVGAGYDRTFSRLKPIDRGDRFTPVPGGGWRSIRVDPRTSMVTLPSGVGLDFGGIAKGMAVDAALEWLAGEGLAFAAVDGGGDLRVHGSLPDHPGWPVAVEAAEATVNVALFEGALATSSIGKRKWVRGGQRRHHILDPRTGCPVLNGVRSVTVAAARCAEAEVVAKTALTLGPRLGQAYLQQHGWAAMMVTSRGTTCVGGWPEGDKRSAA